MPSKNYGNDPLTLWKSEAMKRLTLLKTEAMKYLTLYCLISSLHLRQLFMNSCQNLMQQHKTFRHIYESKDDDITQLCYGN